MHFFTVIIIISLLKYNNFAFGSFFPEYYHIRRKILVDSGAESEVEYVYCTTDCSITRINATHLAMPIGCTGKSFCKDPYTIAIAQTIAGNETEPEEGVVEGEKVVEEEGTVGTVAETGEVIEEKGKNGTVEGVEEKVVEENVVEEKVTEENGIGRYGEGKTKEQDKAESTERVEVTENEEGKGVSVEEEEEVEGHEENSGERNKTVTIIEKVEPISRIKEGIYCDEGQNTTKLNAPVDVEGMGIYVSPIENFVSNVSFHTKGKCKAVGYGMEKYGISTKKTEGSVRIVKSRRTKVTFKHEEKRICSGDSGGALICDDKLVAVITKITGCVHKAMAIKIGTLFGGAGSTTSHIATSLIIVLFSFSKFIGNTDYVPITFM